jgi:hypothetical protein
MSTEHIWYPDFAQEFLQPQARRVEEIRTTMHRMAEVHERTHKLCERLQDEIGELVGKSPANIIVELQERDNDVFFVVHFMLATHPHGDDELASMQQQLKDRFSRLGDHPCSVALDRGDRTLFNVSWEFGRIDCATYLPTFKKDVNSYQGDPFDQR